MPSAGRGGGGRGARSWQRLQQEHDARVAAEAASVAAGLRAAREAGRASREQARAARADSEAASGADILRGLSRAAHAEG